MLNKGFIINEENRQHINLSTRAMTMIEADMIRFNDDHELKNKSGFMNTIIANYYDSFPLSRSVALKQINAIQTAIKTDSFGDKVIHKIVGEFTNEIMKNTIIEYADKYNNEIQFKLKLNNENTSLLESLEDSSYFEAYAPRSGVGFYLKIIFESYANLNREDRERIFFKETIENIEKAIKNKTVIRFNDKGEFKNLLPFAIFKPSDQHSLELAYGTPKMDSESVIYNTIKIKILEKQGIKITKEKFKSDIDTEFIKNFFQQRTTVSAKPIETFTIRFTCGGLQRFIFEEDSIPIIGFPDLNDEHLYTFITTETQMFLHLFKFGLQAKIISPIKAKNRFKKLYKASYEAYELMD